MNVVDGALGPDERGIFWVDDRGVEWRSIGKPGESYDGYGAMWQHNANGYWMYGTPTAEHAPYRRRDPDLNSVPARLERLTDQLTELKDNTGNDEVGELISYALAHLNYAVKVLQGETCDTPTKAGE